MAATIYQSGRLGNCFFAQAFIMAYAKKYNLEYSTPMQADAYKFHAGHNRNPFSYIPSTGNVKMPIIRFRESNIHTEPSYQADIPKMPNVIFDGYFQSFLYFDWCRNYILEKFNFPDNPEDITSISVRRGDCVNSPNFPMAPIEYYQKAVKYMQSKGFNKFRVHSDDILWCMANFTSKLFPEAEFQFSTGKTEMEDYHLLVNSRNNITARSTFSLTSAWANKNPHKIVCVPSDEKFKWWKGQNKDLLTNTGFVKIDFSKIQD